MEKQLSFFPEELPPGLSYFSNFISLEEELCLMSFFQTLKWQEVHMHGVVARRKVVHYGYDYTYDTRSVTLTIGPPNELNFLLKRAAKALGVSVAELGEALITWYPKGAGIGWHRDAPMFESLLGISLGGSATLKLREGFDSRARGIKIELEPRSAYIIQGPARWKWQHHIPPQKEDRYSITLRTLKSSS